MTTKAKSKGAGKEAGPAESTADAEPFLTGPATLTCKTCDGRGWLQGVIGGCPACGGVGRVPARIEGSKP